MVATCWSEGEFGWWSALFLLPGRWRWGSPVCPQPRPRAKGERQNDALIGREAPRLKAKPSQPQVMPWQSLSRAGMGLASVRREPGRLRLKSCEKPQHQLASGTGITSGRAHKHGSSSSGEIAAFFFFLLFHHISALWGFWVFYHKVVPKRAANALKLMLLWARDQVSVGLSCLWLAG